MQEVKKSRAKVERRSRIRIKWSLNNEVKQLFLIQGFFKDGRRNGCIYREIIRKLLGSIALELLLLHQSKKRV